MTYQFADVAVTGPVAVVTMNRPERLNALSEELESDVCAALLDAEADTSVRAIVLAGAGRAFCAGHDLKEGRNRPPLSGPERAAAVRRRTGRILRATLHNTKPVIARIHGFCLGAGTDIAGSCDFAVCSDDATFGYPVLRNTTLLPSSLWPWQIGIARAKEIVFTGDVISAQRALSIGMVNHVVPRDDLDDFTHRLAMRTALGVSKHVQKQWLNSILTTALGLPAAMEFVFGSHEQDLADGIPEDWREILRTGGVRAYVQWRQERWAPYESRI
jgi:enoyl-CoA hydratase/carnithine racemase